jgi:hypothetical protein
VVNPPTDSPLAAYRFEDVELLADGVVDLTVPSWSVPREHIAARITDPQGRGLSNVIVRGEPLGAGDLWTVTTDPAGDFSRAVVPGRYRIDVEPAPDSEIRGLHLSSVDLPCGLPATLSLSPIVRVIPPARRIRTWPNPWGSFASIALDLVASEPDATLEVFDVTGRRVRTLYRGALPAGTTDLRWDGTNDRGRPVASGFYVLRLVSERQTLTHKFTRIRRR